LITKAQQNQTVAKGVETIKSSAMGFWNAVTTLKEETQKSIDEKERARGETTAPVNSNTTVSSPTTTTTNVGTVNSVAVNPPVENLIEIPNETKL